MKHTIIKTLLAILFLLPAWSFAQDKAIAKIFDEYSGKSGYTSVDISKGLFQLFAQLEADDPEFDDLQKALEGLESLRLVAYSIEGDKGTTEEKNSFVSNIKSNVPFDEFKELMELAELADEEGDTASLDEAQAMLAAYASLLERARRAGRGPEE